MMRSMKVTDYIVQFLIEKGCTHTFGYPGGSSANLVNSFYKYRDKISAHVSYNEQGAAFAACGYAQVSGKIGVAYSIGGPGATNLLTGIGHAYFDSLPLFCITGNVNTYESSRGMKVRQRAFQECDIIPIVSSITKYCAYVERPEDIHYQLERAYTYAMNGRRGPVLLDLPMDVANAEVDVDCLKRYKSDHIPLYNKDEVLRFNNKLAELLELSERPCLILGNGIKRKSMQNAVKCAVEHLNIPFVTSMIAFDIQYDNPLRFGFLGASGDRSANFIAAKSDLIISIGSRLDIRQVGVNRERFAPNARVIRVDIDEGELEYKLHKDEFDYCIDAKEALKIIASIEVKKDYSFWRDVCRTIRDKTSGLDMRLPNKYMKLISQEIPDNTVITTDVGQNQVWTAQNFQVKKNQMVLFSGGFGSMGHALPAAIGAYYGSGNISVAIAGDGGMQMNIQELQFVAREQIPVKIIVFNNHALGMIRHFQEAWFDGVFYQTKPEGGFSSPSFKKIADAYEIDSIEINSVDELCNCKQLFESDKPALIEVQIMENTYEYPKLRFGSQNQDQEPLLDRGLFEELMNL